MKKWDCKSFTLDLTDLGTQGHESLLPSAWNAFQQKCRSGKIGFYDWPEKISAEEISAIESLASSIRKNYEGAVVFGIGGSFLGAAAVVQAVGDDFPLHWVSNIDPPAIEKARQFAKSGKRAAIVISKSGGTVETLSAFFHLLDHFEKEAIVTITDPQEGELRRLTRLQGWKSFEVPPNIGGRYSVLTSVGLVPCAIAGVSPLELIQGGRDLRALSQNPQNAASALALALWDWDVNKNHPIQVLMPYWSSLRLFADWYVQLFAESLGKNPQKEGAPVGPTPFPALGTSDQHSILQLLREGSRDKIVGFMGVDDPGSPKIGRPKLPVQGFDYLYDHSFGTVSQKALESTEMSLQNGKIPTYRIQLHGLHPRTLGALFFLFETACGVAAELYGVDGFNQPGVEETKILLKKSLSK